MLGRHQKIIHLFLGLVITLAFLAQSIIPTGYMPTYGSGKFFQISICQGAEQTTILVDENMQPVSQDLQKNQDHAPQSGDPSKSCFFATGAVKHLAFQSFLYQQIEHLTYARFVVRDTAAPVIAYIGKPYQGQAPPAPRQII